MLLATRPTPAQITRLIDEQRPLPFSYEAVGMTRVPNVPAGFVVDRYRARIGQGEADFRRACDALLAWTIFAQPWMHLVPEHDAVEPGTMVAVMSHQLGFWTLNACRVVYRFDEPDRIGFAYGTLPEHVQRGEERFLVEQLADGQVWCEVLAASRPAHWLARVGYPVARLVQKRFGRGAMAAMQDAVCGPR
jgi:uncharacterized protein (UPF0548 family)